MKRGRTSLWLAVAMVAAAAGGCAGGVRSPDQAMAGKGSGEQARQVLKRSCDFLAAARSLSFDVRSQSDDYLATGQLVQFTRTSRLVVVRPNSLRADTEGAAGRWLVIFHDGKLDVASAAVNQYAEEPVEGDFEKLFDFLATRYKLLVPGHDLLIADPYASLSAYATDGEYLGLHRVGDQPCHHLLFRTKTVDWQIWVADGDQPLPRKIIITYKSEPGAPQYEAAYDNWSVAPDVLEGTFAFVPPEGATRTTMAELLERRAGGKR